MNYYIAVFSSRTSSFAFNDILARNKIAARIMSTPSKAKASCGVCVKFAPIDFDKVKHILEMRREFSSASFYRVLQSGGGEIFVSKL